MRLHEYQAKALFQSYGIPVPRHVLAQTPLQVRRAAEKLIQGTVVVKAQVQSDGRTRAGGVKVVDTPREAEDYARAMLGSYLITESSGPAGQPINALLVEETCEVSSELYLGLQTDPVTLQTLITASCEEETDYDKPARTQGNDVARLAVNLKAGIHEFQCRQLSQRLRLSIPLTSQFTQLLKAVCRLYADKGLARLEIKPLVVTEQGCLLCLDGTIFVPTQSPRQPLQLQSLRDKSQQRTPELPRRPRTSPRV